MKRTNPRRRKSDWENQQLINATINAERMMSRIATNRAAAIARQRALGLMPSVQQIRRASGEKKGVDTILTLSPVIATTNTNGSMFVVNTVRPGNGSYNRVGRRIFNKSLRIKIRGNMNIVSQTTTYDIEGNSLRMVVVWDTQPSGVLPTFDTIFGSTTQAGTEATSIVDPIKYDNLQRFKILKDCWLPLNIEAISSGAANADNDYAFFIDEYINLKNRVTTFSGDSSPSTIADISTGGLYIVFRAAVNSAGVNTVAITADSIARLRYSD